MSFENPNNDNESSIEKQEQPQVLYHGSPTRQLGEIKPFQKHVRDREEGPKVFASHDRAIATIFLGQREGGVVHSGLFGEVPYAIILNTREQYLSEDIGGALYELPPETFENDPAKGLGPYEWTSRKPVIPNNFIEYETSLDAMISAGVQVYFVDDETLGRIRESSDHGYSILKSLTSENERQNLNVRPL